MYFQEYQGKGTVDGTFRRNHFFKTRPDSAVFVPLNKIKRCLDHNQFKEIGFQVPAEYEPEEEPPLPIGDRVVWVSDSGPEHGTVKWIGFLHDTRDKEWTVGVEFVSQLLFV